MSLSSHKGYQAYAAALFAVFIWGAFPTLVKDALKFTSVEQLLTLRFLISTLLFSFFLPRTLRKIREVSFKNLAVFFLASITVFYSQTYVLDQVPASWYVSVFTFVPILFLIVYRERLSLIGRLGSGLAVFGMALFFISMRHAEGMSFWHLILLIISMLAWVVYSVFAKKLHSHFKDQEVVALTNIIGLVSSCFFWGIHGFQGQVLSFSGLALCLLAGMVLPVALVAYSFSLRFKPVFAMFSQYLEPVIGLVIAALLLGERMHFLQYIAAFIVITGTFFVGIATRK